MCLNTKDPSIDGFDSPLFARFQEFKRGLDMMGFKPTEAEFQSLMKIVDKDGSGEIDYEEFASKMTKMLGDEGDANMFDRSATKNFSSLKDYHSWLRSLGCALLNGLSLAFRMKRKWSVRSQQAPAAVHQLQTGHE
eukprot:SAG31_NODE_1673_length_7560_cov_3.528749_7_plen_136_part_00